MRSHDFVPRTRGTTSWLVYRKKENDDAALRRKVAQDESWRFPARCAAVWHDRNDRNDRKSEMTE